MTVDIVSGDAQGLALMMAAKELDITIFTSGGGAHPQEVDRVLLEQPLVWAMH